MRGIATRHNLKIYSSLCAVISCVFTTTADDVFGLKYLSRPVLPYAYASIRERTGRQPDREERGWQDGRHRNERERSPQP